MNLERLSAKHRVAASYIMEQLIKHGDKDAMDLFVNLIEVLVGDKEREIQSRSLHARERSITRQEALQKTWTSQFPKILNELQNICDKYARYEYTPESGE